MSSSLVDCLVPVFNGENYLESSLKSLLNQSHSRLRVIVVDDGSTDGTAALLQTWAAGDSRIHAIHQPNAGIVAALNRGLAEVKAPIIIRQDADDIADHERVSLQVDYLSKNAAVVAIGGRVRSIDADGRDLGPSAPLDELARASATWMPAREPYLLHPFLAVRTDAIRRVGGYRYVRNAEDSDLYWRLQEVGQLRNLPDHLGLYRMHSQSISSQSVKSGRIMAVSSQLAALSARRRSAKRSDVVFSQDLAASMTKASDSLDNLIALYADQLSTEELTWLRLASACKLFELADYRPYEPELQDCVSWARSWRAGRHALARANAAAVRRAAIGTAARLRAKGHVREADALPTGLLGGMEGRLRTLSRRLLPLESYQRIGQLLRRRAKDPVIYDE